MTVTSASTDELQAGIATRKDRSGANLTPVQRHAEVIRIPLIIHLPQRLRSSMVWNGEDVVRLRDITPTLYDLLGHRPLKTDPMVGVHHCLLMSSYQAVFGDPLSRSEEAVHDRCFPAPQFVIRSECRDPSAFKNRATADIVEQDQPVLRQDLENIDKFSNVSEQQLSH